MYRILIKAKITLFQEIVKQRKTQACICCYVHVSFTVSNAIEVTYFSYDNKQLLDKVEHDSMNYQNRGLCYMPKPKAEADNTDTRF